ncbi:MAG: chromate transporter [Firmicutes bacterium]|nr:chromate transporter [Bacillota bacterium]
MARPRLFLPAGGEKEKKGREKGFFFLGTIPALFGAFFTIGALTFGGGYAMIPLIQRIIIGQHRWLNGTEFLEILAISQMTPGPIAINAATFVGYKIAGTMGSAAATVGVILPSLVIVLALAGVFYKYRHLPVVVQLSAALRVAVIALIAAAVISVGRGAISNWKDAVLAGAVVVLLLKTKISPFLVLVLAAGAGVMVY